MFSSARQKKSYKHFPDPISKDNKILLQTIPTGGSRVHHCLKALFLWQYLVRCHQWYCVLLSICQDNVSSIFSLYSKDTELALDCMCYVIWINLNAMGKFTILRLPLFHTFSNACFGLQPFKNNGEGTSSLVYPSEYLQLIPWNSPPTCLSLSFAFPSRGMTEIWCSGIFIPAEPTRVTHIYSSSTTPPRVKGMMVRMMTPCPHLPANKTKHHVKIFYLYFGLLLIEEKTFRCLISYPHLLDDPNLTL